ncbi:CoA transferase [Castellaniella sp. GW247-6E4]|uniref:CaiB/BaiF CoA transferase family protein n=1 Tax=Castellaniella sp. GW247-6E4 TaxID=3140380 RepID=UPI0033164678
MGVIEQQAPDVREGGALAGIRVIDFSRMLPGPWCGQMLADLGADVIKVEQPEVGDLGRHNAPNFVHGSVYFNTVNLNKRSIALDLKREADQAIAQRLIESADVVIESFRDGVPARLGIDYERAREIKPDIIYCSITGFGHSGPWAAIPGHDLVIQSTTGIMAAGTPGPGAPAIPGHQSADYAASSYAAIGILAALHRRAATGEGGYLDISMFDSLFSMSNIVNGGALARAAGNDSTPEMALWGGNPRYSTYLTQDGKAVAVSLLETAVWRKFCALIGREDLIHEEETPRDRHTEHGERATLYFKAISDLCLSRPRDELIAWMVARDMPILPVYTPDEAIHGPQVRARHLVEWVDHPTEGRIPVLGNPLARSGLLAQGRRPAPDLGEHGAVVLAELAETQARRVARRDDSHNGGYS